MDKAERILNTNHSSLNMKSEHFAELCQQLGMMVLAKEGSGQVFVVTPPTVWFPLLCKVADSAQERQVDKILSEHLDSFCKESADHFSNDKNTTLRSELWIEIDEEGKNWPFEADAIRAKDKILFIIKHVPEKYHREQTLSQHLRENYLLKELLEEKAADQAHRIASREVELEREINERIAIQKQLTRLAFHDDLTGLPNRALFFDRLQQAIADAQRKNDMLAVMFIDLDEFKKINDSLGHSIGDEVIKYAGKQFQQCLRDVDSIARLGGDEFTILLSHLNSKKDVEIVAQRLLQSMEKPFKALDNNVQITVSIGISAFPADGLSAESLLRNADTAMYHAKHDQGATYRFYTPEMGTSPSKRLALTSDLEQALERNEFFVVYQPIICLQTLQVTGAEAYLRWRRGDGEILSPDRFVPVATEFKLVERLGEWVIEKTCAQLKNWRLIYGPNFRMNLNLSLEEIESQKCQEALVRNLNANLLPHDKLEIEISGAIQNRELPVFQESINAIKSLHISTALDKFGESPTSLSTIKQLKFDRIKIDRYFIKRIAQSRDDFEIFKGLVAFAKSLSSSVLAEGVEETAQLELVQKTKIDEAQGHLFTAPLEAHFFEQWMREYQDRQKQHLRLVKKEIG